MEAIQWHLVHMYKHETDPTTNFIMETLTDLEKCHTVTTLSNTRTV